MSIERRLTQLEAIEHPTRYLVVGLESLITPEQSRPWRAANPRGTVVRVVYAGGL